MARIDAVIDGFTFHVCPEELKALLAMADTLGPGGVGDLVVNVNVILHAATMKLGMPLDEAADDMAGGLFDDRYRPELGDFAETAYLARRAVLRRVVEARRALTRPDAGEQPGGVFGAAAPEGGPC